MKSEIIVFYSNQEVEVNDFDCLIWQQVEQTALTQYWSGEPAPPERQAVAQLLWTNKALFVRFDCAQHEPLIVNQDPDTQCEAEQLWERDVCEIFIAPDKDEPEKYFEFEVAPTGEWLDYKIVQLTERRETDTSFDSGIKTATRTGENKFSLIFKIEWSAFGKKPVASEEWAGNLFRCIGAGDARGYLAWQPTFTDKPNFHVPAAFGVFKF